MVSMQVGESYDRRGLGSFGGANGLTGIMHEEGNTSFDVGLVPASSTVESLEIAAMFGASENQKLYSKLEKNENPGSRTNVTLLVLSIMASELCSK